MGQADTSSSFVRKVVIAAVIPIGMLLLLALLKQVGQVLLLFFVGALLALFLRAGSDLIARYTHLPPAWSLLVFILLLILVFSAFAWLGAPHVGQQLDQLSQQLPQALQRLEDRVRSIPWARSVLQSLPSAMQQGIQQQSALIMPALRAFSLTVGAFAALFVLIAVGIYLAANPSLYTGAFLQLFPPRRRERMGEVLEHLAHVLRMWLLGRAIGMLFVGVLTALGLLWLNIPLALALGFIAAILDFVPNIGPLLAAVPAILIALTTSPTLALYVIALYVAVQALEAYLIEPMIEQRVVRIAPAYNIIFQIALAILLGFLGLLLATPFMVTVMVLTQELYIRDVLEAPPAGRKE